MTYTLQCDVAALLNVTPDHLERYDGFGGYAASKARLFAMQRSDQFAVFGTSDETTLAVAEHENQRRNPAKVRAVDGRDLAGLQPDWPSLQGPHNLQNAAVAVAIAEALGLTAQQWRPALASFRGLPHRMERVADVNGVMFINDSKEIGRAHV